MALIGAHIDAFEYCPDHPDGTVARYCRISDRRKPAPGMITDLAQRFSVDMTRSMVVGDKDSDMVAAQVAEDPAEHADRIRRSTRGVPLAALRPSCAARAPRRQGISPEGA